MKNWKSLIAAAAVVVFAGTVFAGCGSGDGGGIAGGIGGPADNGPAAPKERLSRS